jgi:MFS family permease
MVTDYFPLAQRGRAMGLVSMGGSVGIVISLALGGWIAEHWLRHVPVDGHPGCRSCC